MGEGWLNWIMAASALIQCVVGIFAVRAAIDARAARTDAGVTRVNMALVEKATNSMKDALVAATAKASFAEGHTTAVAEGVAKAAAVAEGIVVGKNLTTANTASAAIEPPLALVVKK